MSILRNIGPAIIVAAVVLGPGSILTSSKVGASFGPFAVFAVLLATVLMIGMVALAARVGVSLEGSPCTELANRLGRPVAVFIGLILFTLVAFFQSSNNIAVVGGLEPLFGTEIGLGGRIGIVLAVNGVVIACLYLARNLYGSVERLMKVLIGMMVLAFLVNFLVVLFMTPPAAAAVEAAVKPPDVMALLGMMGTTFSVAGAFYQAYMVRERGWGIADARRGMIDSIVSISVLGFVTAIILLTAARVFHGTDIAFTSVGDVALQLKPTFGAGATVIFGIGILAGAFSSILVNAMIGGTVLADSLGRGSRMNERGPLHLTTLALVIGAAVALASFAREGSTVHLITLAQACTVIGLPVLAAALLYLGTRKELRDERRVPRWILSVALIGFLVACGLAYRLLGIVLTRL